MKNLLKNITEDSLMFLKTMLDIKQKDLRLKQQFKFRSTLNIL